MGWVEVQSDNDNEVVKLTVRDGAGNAKQAWLTFAEARTLSAHIGQVAIRLGEVSQGVSMNDIPVHTE